MLEMASELQLDAIDVHLHMVSAKILKSAIAKVRQATKLPLVTMEWSQAPVVQTSGWLNRKQNGPFGNVTNMQFMNTCYETRVTQSQWDAFMSTAPYDKSFMRQAISAFSENNFLYAMYGAAFQYGNPKFDSKQLFATKCVKQPGGASDLPPNNPLLAWFLAQRPSPN